MIIMNKSPLEQYMDKLKNMNDKEYLFGIILYHVAPTLLSDKPSCIITLGKNKRNLNLLWERYREDFLSISKLEIYEIKKRFESKTLFIYDKDMLSKIIYQDENIRFLKKFGYDKNFNIEEMLQLLKERFKYFCPHEMGVFLGFPLKDVICFMEHPDKKSLLSGYWKVYNNVHYAEKKFINYDNAKCTIVKSVLQGMLPSLIVENKKREIIMY